MSDHQEDTGSWAPVLVAVVLSGGYLFLSNSAWYWKVLVALVIFIATLFIVAAIQWSSRDEQRQADLKSGTTKSTDPTEQRRVYESSVNLRIITPIVEEYIEQARSNYEALPSQLKRSVTPPSDIEPSFFLQQYERGIKNAIRGVRDPRLYGSKYLALRVRIQSGTASCLNCQSKLFIRLPDVERRLLQQLELVKATGGKDLLLFQPDWSVGAFCNTEGELLCPECTSAAVSKAFDSPLCPKCSGVLQGIDHITD